MQVFSRDGQQPRAQEYLRLYSEHGEKNNKNEEAFKSQNSEVREFGDSTFQRCYGHQCKHKITTTLTAYAYICNECFFCYVKTHFKQSKKFLTLYGFINVKRSE